MTDPSTSRLSPPAFLVLRLSLCLILAGGAALLWTRVLQAGSASRVLRARYLMGTVLEIDAVGRDAASTEAAVASAFQVVAGVEARLSNWRPDSELSRANALLGGGAPAVLSPETFASLSTAWHLARETDGAFDPTVGALTEALGLTGQAPDCARIAAERARIGWRRCILDRRLRTMASSADGTVIDSGAFGKGEALDRAIEALRRGGVTAARLNFGGQISVFGTATSAARRFTRVAVASPEPDGIELRRFRITDASVSTSGDSEKPGHLIDPRTGTSASFHGSVTVVADSGLRADALSTALFVLGPREGLTFAERHGIAALFIFRERNAWTLRASRLFPLSSVD